MPPKGSTVVTAARRFVKRGYVFVKVASHPNADSQGYVTEHRIVAEQTIGRVLQSDEIVHHINGQRDDNRPENLQVLTRSAHRVLHCEQNRLRWSPERDNCASCGTTERAHQAHGFCERCYARDWARAKRKQHR